MAFTPVQYSPPNQRLNSNATSISSIDEEVPKPRCTGIDGSTPIISPQAIVESQDQKTADRKPSISSLNPTTSRFTLRLPLLGRPKVPLDQAVASAQAEDVRELSPAESAETSQPTNATKTEAPITNETEATPQVINVVPPTPDEHPPQPAAAQETTDNSGAADSRSASWWDYISWGGHGQDPSSKPSDSKDDDGSSEDTAKVSSEPPASAAADAQPPAPVEQPSDAAAQAPESQPQQNDDQNDTQDASVSHEQKQKADGKPASVFSAETAKSPGSTWYSPWAWYSSSASASNTEPPKDSSASGSTDAPKTESEMVKEEALARDQEEQTPKPSPSPEPAAVREAPEAANPIQSTVADNKSGWMSFFVSRAATMKAVTNEVTENKDSGMEVMDIDDEPDPSVAIEVPTSKDVQRAAASPKALSLLSTSPKPSSPSPPPTPKSPKKSPAGPPPKEREPKKQEPPAPPLTDSESIKRDTTRGARSPSPTPSKSSKVSTPPNSAKPQAPNLVLPTWADTFHSPPRSHPPPRTPTAKSKLTGALSSIAGALFSEGARGKGRKGKGKEREQFGTWAAPPTGQQGAEHAPEILMFGQELPKALDVLGEQLNPYILNGGCRVVVIGVAGWSPGAVTRTLAGGLPSSSSKFVNMTVQALEQFADENGFKFKKITPMPLEGDGTIRKKVSRVYNHLLDNEEWMEDLHAADVIFVASHSQGGVVSTHLIDRLIEDGHILTSRSVDTLAKTAASIAAGGAATVPAAQAQKVCLLSLCGIHLGPLRYMKTSSLLQPYFQYVENASARELFEFQNTESKLSKNYAGALRNILHHGTKVVYIASLNDQVVPVYSGVFTAASHPRILRALYIDSDAYHSSDFLSNLLILLIRIMNAGLSDRGLLAHLSEATAGTLSGVGHSTAYEEPATYSLAVKYFFMTNDGSNSDAELVMNPFNAVEEQNDYEIPWLLRDMIADAKISHFFSREFAQLRDAFDDWQPKTTILREVKKKLQPITRLSTTTTLASSSISKL
ncbi:hypothetical protein L226DRAFT_466538 [Lentinus tigrinus ALCF2SS1-7]|uniref:YMC020W-like alpha/beta hydrolase domain-containing protein n=1 Tax=Lentinus tigrinus ALCF2SS1-6 TaxID=1328759 RepID=A0A5C2S5Z1_9APHY|nr:hypothetical protein L227DRAFT_504881 [Lentinus tigrinus ALCF2SS1-6]RPD72715.1 hypothetical protein L226DRAFT_466538 [Lentinus tigrinus ALCF2SS1-7]